MSRIRVAVVGIGKMGLLHASILSASPGVHLVAICERNWLVRRHARSMFQRVVCVPSVADLAGMGIDAIYVTTPPPSHAAIIRVICLGGIARHVFVEKPLSMNTREARELCQLARERLEVTMVGYQKRFSVVFGKAKQLLESRELGELRSFAGYAFSSDFAGNGGHAAASAARGGALRDIGSHTLDLITWLLGEPAVDRQNGAPAARVTPYTAHAALRADDVVGELRLSSAMRGYRLPEFGLRIAGSAGEMDVNDDRVFLRRAGREPQVWYRQDLPDHVDFLLGEPEYVREDRTFLAAIRDRRRSEPDFASAAKVDRVMDEIAGSRPDGAS
jgi:predicted dehydrogenase